MKKVAILQSNYIPWHGYFDIIASVDEFVIYDHVQYTKNDWRNRNRIRINNEAKWLVIPCFHNLSQRINETKIAKTTWRKKHLATIEQGYRKAANFERHIDFIRELYKFDSDYLSQVNEHFIREICKFLGINTRISQSTDYELWNGKTECLIGICQQLGAATYLSGDAAKSYLDVNKMRDDYNIQVAWMAYKDYERFSIIDYILNNDI